MLVPQLKIEIYLKSLWEARGVTYCKFMNSIVIGEKENTV